MPEVKAGPVPELRFPEFRDAGPWEVKRLGDGISLISGQHLGPTQYTNERSDYPYFTGPSDFTNDQDAVTKWVAESVSPQLAKNGDVLVTVKGSGVGELWHLKLETAAMGRQLMAVRGENFEPGFLLHFLSQKRAHLAALAAGNMIPGLSRDDLLSLPVPIPPHREEQQKIAACLGSLDDLIRAEEGRLKALRAHKTGLMQRLFPRPGETTPRLRFPEFRDAGPWEVKRLGDLLALEYGSSLPEDQRIDGPFPVVGSNGVVGYHNASLIDGPAIVIGRKGSAGEISWIENACFPIDTTFYVKLRRPSDRLGFIKSLLEMHRLPDLVSPGGVPGLNRDDVQVVRTAIPKPEEQQKIADCLTSLDDLIRAQGETIEALKAHKTGLMQQLFPREVV